MTRQCRERASEIVSLLTTSALLLALASCSNPSISPAHTSTPTPVLTRVEAIPADAIKQGPETDPAPPILHSTEWVEPVPLPGPINTAGSEDSPYITPDGTEFFFFFTPDSLIPAEQQLNDGSTGIYYTSRSSPDSAWAEPVFLQLADPGESALNGCPTLFEQTLWFCSARIGGYRSIDMYTADFRLGTAENWVNAGEELNQQVGIGELHFSADGETIYFHADLPGGKGSFDIWVTHQIEGQWQPPQNVNAVNSAEMDGWPYLTPDGSALWFTRTWQGSPAVFRSLWNGEDWGEPELIVSQFAGEPTLDSQGNLYFVHHFIHSGIILEADIYYAESISP